MKNSLKGRSELAKERISKLKERLSGHMQWRNERKKKRVQENEWNLRDFRTSLKVPKYA